MTTLLDTVFTPLARAERSIRHAIKLNYHCMRIRRELAAGAQPVIVYSPQKTGSTAVQVSLMQLPGICMMKGHVLLPEHDWDGVLDNRVHPDGTILLGSHGTHSIRKMVLEPRLPSKWIVTLREPIACNLSWFSFQAERNWLRDHRRDLDSLSVEDVTRLFLERFPHHSVGTWAKVEMGAVLGFDPYATPFDHAKGYQRIQSGPYDVLIMRQDLDDERKSAALNEHLGRTDVKVIRANESGGGPGGIYARLKKGIRAHPEYFERMLETEDARHWWSDGERAAIRAKWLAPERGKRAE
ncbi:MAG: hypothetical protein RIS45_933 [Planctomycetota bacterium]|jgi:hypothetical protein